MDFGQLVLALLLALWLAHVTKSKVALAARWGLAVLSLAAIFANVPTFASVVVPHKPKPSQWVQVLPSRPPTDQIPSFFTDGSYKRYIKPGENVVIVSHRGNAGMMFQAYTDFYFNIAGGFINASLSREDALPGPVANLSHLPAGVAKQRIADFKAYVTSAQIGAIIVERAWSEHWMYVFGKLGLKTTTVGDVTIFQTSLGK
jgi:hypothetical protein